jgi:hypothetical protein
MDYLLERTMKSLILVLLSLLIVACTSAPPTLQTGPDAEWTFDGLVRVDNSRFRDAWADPEVEFSQYNKVMPGWCAVRVPRRQQDDWAYVIVPRDAE